ncbi:MAG: hypothetical protein V7607_6143 [Solirubrobacteraceae bacterium]
MNTAASAERKKKDEYLRTLRATRVVVVDEEAHAGGDAALRRHPPTPWKRKAWRKETGAEDADDDAYDEWLASRIAEAEGTKVRGDWHRAALEHVPEAAASPLDILAVVFGEGYTALHPNEWNALESEQLDELERDALVLFDRDLKEFGRGDDLAQAFLADHPLARAAIFTNAVTIGEGEIADAEKLRQTHPVIVASKARLQSVDDMPRFVDELRLTSIARHLIDARRRVLDLAESAHEEALREVRDLELRTLEDVVIGASRDEGIFEADTLIRVLMIEYRHAFRARFLEDEGRVLGELLADFESARRAAPLKRVPDVASRTRTQLLMNKERYAEADIINRPGLPLACGDIFRRDHDDSLWMLLEQPCDLQLRDEGDTREEITHTELVSIAAGDPAGRSHGLPPQAASFEHPHFLALKRRLAVPLNVLELCVFRQDGECAWEEGTEQPQTVPQTPGVARRFASIRLQMEELVSQAGTVPDEHLLRAGDLIGASHEGVLRWGLRRVERLEEGQAAAALGAAMADRARPGLDPDFPA